MKENTETLFGGGVQKNKNQLIVRQIDDLPNR